MYINSEIKSWTFYVNSVFTLGNSSLGSVKLTTNADPGKYYWSGYDISFDVGGTFSLPNDEFGKNVIVFTVDINSSAHVNDKKKISHFLVDVQRKS